MLRALSRCLVLIAMAASLPLSAAGPPATRLQALKAIDHPEPDVRRAAVARLGEVGAMADADRLVARLGDDDAPVRQLAEAALWQIWSRSGDAAIDRLMAAGIEQMQAGRYRESVAAFSEVIRRRPEFAEGWNKRATVHYLAGDYPRSLADCDQVMKRNPQHFGALSGYGQIYFQLEQYDKAIEYWRRALEVNPNMLGVEFNIKGAEELLRQKRGSTT